MGFIPGDDQWKTADMVEAERVVAEQSAALDDAIAEARSVEVEIEPMTEAEVASLDAAARAPEAPPGLRELARKVDSGQLTWRDVVDGDATRHREVGAALADIGRHVDDGGVLSAISQAYQAGHSMDEIQQAIDDGRFSPADGVRPVPVPDDDEYFRSDGYFREQTPRRAAAPVEVESFEEITYRL